MKERKQDLLTVRIYDTRMEMGKAAAADAAKKLRRCLQEKETVNVIFAAAPSQNEMLDALVEEPGIAWNRVNAFHMDEYIGLPVGAPQAFGMFLQEHIFSRVPFRQVFCIDAAAQDKEAECARYAQLLQEHPVDLVLLGIGENGHIAFNDPHVADFSDPETVKAVSLDQVCRQQQVNDGCFAKLEDVPEYALTLTVPALTRAKHMVCTVPAATKAWAVEQTVRGQIGEQCPATIMRRHEDAVMYCDKESGGALL